MVPDGENLPRSHAAAAQACARGGGAAGPSHLPAKCSNSRSALQKDKNVAAEVYSSEQMALFLLQFVPFREDATNTLIVANPSVPMGKRHSKKYVYLTKM